MLKTKEMFKIGDVVEFAACGNFEYYKGNIDNDYYDIGTVIQVSPYIKVLWNSDGKVNNPYHESIRAFNSDDTKETKEDYYICLTKEDVEGFINSLSTFPDEYYCSDYENARTVIDDIIAFKNKAKENSKST